MSSEERIAIALERIAGALENTGKEININGSTDPKQVAELVVTKLRRADAI